MRSPSADAAAERLATLTQREKEILKLFAEGLTYQEIGEIRNNSGLTVRNAVSGIQRKLGFKTRQQMVVWRCASAWWMTPGRSPWHLERIPFLLNGCIQNTRADKWKLPPGLLDGVALARDGNGSG